MHEIAIGILKPNAFRFKGRRWIKPLHSEFLQALREGSKILLEKGEAVEAEFLARSFRDAHPFMVAAKCIETKPIAFFAHIKPEA